MAYWRERKVDAASIKVDVALAESKVKALARLVKSKIVYHLAFEMTDIVFANPAFGLQ